MISTLRRNFILTGLYAIVLFICTATWVRASNELDVSINTREYSKGSAITLNIDIPKFSLKIAGAVHTYLNSKNIRYSEKRDLLVSRTQALRPIGETFLFVVQWQRVAVALGKYTDLPEGLVVQNAYVDFDSSSRLPPENWFSAYLRWVALANIRENYLGERVEAIHNPDIEELVSPNLEMMKDFSIDDMNYYFSEDERRRAAEADIDLPEFVNFNRILRAPRENQLLAGEHILELNRIVSPLFLWMIRQPVNSISYEALFDRALEIYQDPFTALGAITWIASYEGKVERRARFALAMSRMQLISVHTQDPQGDVYHFFGYMIRTMLGYPYDGATLGTMSQAYEGLYQGDDHDEIIDLMAINVGWAINSIIRNAEDNNNIAVPEDCQYGLFDNLKQALVCERPLYIQGE